MSRGVWVIRNGELIPRHLAPPLHVKHSSGPMVISDGMSDTWNPVDGKHYDGKSAYYKAVRDAGCEILGNEMPSASPRPSMASPEQDVVNALDMAEARMPKLSRKKGKRHGI